MKIKQSKQLSRGFLDNRNGVGRHQNPYPEDDSVNHNQWYKDWDEASKFETKLETAKIKEAKITQAAIYLGLFAAVLAAIYYVISSTHGLLIIGATLPDIKVIDPAHQNNNISIQNCKSTTFGNDLECIVEAKEGYIDSLEYVGYEYSKSDRIKLIKAKTPCPIENPSEKVKIRFSFERIHDVDSIAIIPLYQW
jgi:hypothetical protein